MKTSNHKKYYVIYIILILFLIITGCEKLFNKNNTEQEVSLVGKWSKYIPMDPGTHRGNWTNYVEFYADGTGKTYSETPAGNYWSGSYTVVKTHASVNFKHSVSTYNDPIIEEFDFIYTNDQFKVTKSKITWFSGTWNRVY